MNRLSKFYKVSFATLLTALCVMSSDAYAHSSSSSHHKHHPKCAARVEKKLANNEVYNGLYDYLLPFIPAFETLLDAVEDSASYDSLLSLANTVADELPGGSGRIVITLPEGTVVIDTSKPDGVTAPIPQPNTSNSYSNSFTNFQQKNVNENHNSRISILDAQLWPCGVGVGTQYSSSVDEIQNYVAIRLGKYLNSIGTIRISQPLFIPDVTINEQAVEDQVVIEATKELI